MATGVNSVMVRAACVVLVLVLLSACVRADKYDVKNGRHNITMGHRWVYPHRYPPVYRDMLLIHDTPKVDGSWIPYPKVISNDVCYPLKGGYPMFSITAFNVTDQLPNGEGGYAFVKSGGVNSGKLCLHLKTQRGKGYRFVVNIWGYYI